MAGLPPNQLKNVRKVLCCAECDSPLIVLFDGGLYCVKCQFPPSMQDTFIRFICPVCGGIAPKDGKGGYACQSCGQRLANG